MSSPDANLEAWLDAELRDVPLPAGLLARLQKVAELSDEELDADLQAVAIPAGLARRLERIGEREARRMGLYHVATAALLLVAVGLGYLGLTISFVASLRPSLPPAPQHLASQLKLKSSEELEPTELGDLAIALDLDPETFPELRLPGAESVLSFSLDGVALPPLPKGELPASVDLMADRNMTLWPLGSPVDNGDALEDLKKVAGLKPRGSEFPLVLGDDVAFLRRTGFHPFVAPAMNPQLRSLVVPLGVDTESYDLARRYLDDGELPPRSELRTEEFLAAIDYQYPRPTQQALGVFVAGGPSPFHGKNLQLLQLGVQAKLATSSSRPAARLTLLVDTSGSMGWGGRIEMIRLAFSRFAERMPPHDRVSLVAFSDKSYALIEDASRGQREQWKAAIATLPTEGPTNLAAGLRTAYGLAQRIVPSKDVANRVVLLTDGLAGMDEATAMQIDRRLKEAAASGTQLHVIDLSQEREEVEPPPFLSRLARNGGGRVHRATSVDQINWALEAILTGRSQIVAADAQLRITFNPKTVEVYRLLGHEPRTVVPLKPAHPETDFYAGQAATVLWELRLLPNGGNDVASIELTWRDPRSGESHRISQTVQRGQFAASLHQAPLPFQAAVMVAETAEQLRGSLPLFNPTWPNSGSLESVHQLGRQVDSRLLERPTYSAFLALLEKAATARPYRSGGDVRGRFWRENGK